MNHSDRLRDRDIGMRDFSPICLSTKRPYHQSQILSPRKLKVGMPVVRVDCNPRTNEQPVRVVGRLGYLDLETGLFALESDMRTSFEEIERLVRQGSFVDAILAGAWYLVSVSVSPSIGDDCQLWNTRYWLEYPTP